MNYKKIIPSRDLRIKLLQLTSFVPDKLMLQIQYRIVFGRKLNLKMPQRWTEKIQWYKLYYRNSDMVRCVDKYDVRDYIVERGYSKILTNCYGVYEKADDVDYNKLPQSFVLKDTLGGGGNAVIICKDKASFDVNAAKVQMDKWCNTPLVHCNGREWPYYSGKKHRVYVEEYMDVPEGLNDYKFFCFNGKVEFLYVVTDRKLGCGGKFHIVDRNYVALDVIRIGDEPDEIEINKPSCYAEMLKTAEDLSKPFPHVRVDLYEYMGSVRFGELTFFNASGYMKYEPDSFDYEIGEKFILPEIQDDSLWKKYR